jgi:hypothetical protein
MRVWGLLLRRRGLIAAVALTGPLLAGCSGLSMPSMSSFSSVFAAGSTTGAASEAALALPADFECPSVTVRQGASTLSFSANPAEPSAMNLRYQISFAETARECRMAPGNMLSMRVGVQGRIILGPAGAPGQVDVPVRFAIVHEGTSARTIVTKLDRVAVTIPPGDTNVLFTHVQEELVFPMPRGGDIDSYVVYVGFDPLGAQEMDRRRPPPKPQRPPRRQAEARSGEGAIPR